jgi:hypothetical protein
MKKGSTRAGGNRPPLPPKTPSDGGNPADDDADGDLYEDHVRQLRNKRTGRYECGPDGPKRKHHE